MRHIGAALRSLTLGNESHFRNLTIFPLLSHTAASPDYLTLDAALAHGGARIQEISSEGEVEALRFINPSPLPVLICDGQELVGARQDRMINVTVLAPAAAALTLPVCCVESGRWSPQRKTLHSADRTQFAGGRRTRNAAVSASLRSTGTRMVDQYAVWADINAKSARMNVDSPTSAMADIFIRHTDQLDEFVAALEPLPMQVGAVFAIGKRIEGLELFDSPETLAAMLPKLVRSYAIDALEGATGDRSHASRTQANAFLRKTWTAHEEHYPGIGLGEELRVAGRDVVGGGLVLEEKLLHLAAFAQPERTGDDTNITHINLPRLRKE